MTLEEIKAWLKENAGNPDVVAYMQGLQALNIDAVKTFLDTAAEGKAFLTAEKDKHFAKALETWKGNNLEPLVNSKVKELYPEETPEMLEIKKLRAELDAKTKNEAKQTLLNKAITVATEKGLPTKLIERFLGEDEETTLAAIAEFETEFGTAVQSKVDATFKGGGYTPGGNNKGDTGKTGAVDIAAIAGEMNIRNK